MKVEVYQDYVKLKEAIGSLEKDAKNPHFGNSYVELNSTIDAVEERLKENNFLCYIQKGVVKDGKNYLRTELVHNTGEVFDCEFELITTRPDPQMLGSSITYMRRYGLITILGLKAEDDDGNAGAGKVEKKEKKKATFPTVKNGKYENPDWDNLKPEHYEAVVESGGSDKQKAFYQSRIDELKNGKPKTATQMGQSVKYVEEKPEDIIINDEIPWG